ncbi:MAG: tetratricopeptide repeat protein [Planctomycetota bacterium]
MHEQSPKAYSAAIEKIEHLLEIERWKLAEQEVLSLLAEGTTPELLVLLARCRFGREDWDGARVEAKRALELDPEDIDAHTVLAAACIQLGQHRRAETHLLEALRIDPLDVRALYFYSGLMLRTGHLEKAEKLVRRALALDAMHSPSHGLLARILSEKKKRGEALAAGKTSVRLAANEEHSHANLGASYLESGHPFLARRHLREAVRLDPSNTAVLECYLFADRACRVLFLPFYYWSLLVDRLPGKQFAVWGGFLALCLVILPALGAEGIGRSIFLVYVLVCLYTWVASPLTSLWIRMRPPK